MFTAREISPHIKHVEKVGCWVEMWQGDSGICLGRSVTITKETITKVLAASLQEGEYKALHCLKVSAHGVPKLLGSDQKWIQHNLSGENDSLASSGNLWPQTKPWSITSNQRWSQSSGKDLCLTRKLRHWCLQVRWWYIFYRMQKEYYRWTTWKGSHYHQVFHQQERCSSTRTLPLHIHP